MTSFRNALRRLPHVRPLLFLTCRKRWASSVAFGAFANSLSTELALSQPVFRIQASDVRVLRKPKQFYETLLEMINRAEDRIFISSLYIGSEETELISCLRSRLAERPNLQLHMVLDLNRSTRPGPSSTAKILLSLLREFPSQVYISMFRSPSLRGIMARLVPPRFNEGWGTWHAKIYGADNEVMISGANLNKSYFEDRQDRYFHFSQRQMAQYCFDYMETATKFSFRLLPASESQSSSEQPDYTLQWPIPSVHPHHFNSIAEQAFKQLQANYRSMAEETKTLDSDDNTVLIYPIIQAGQFNVREEESLFATLFRTLRACSTSDKPLLDLTSGYFSLYQPYQELILGTDTVDCRIVAAAPKANGFYGSRGVSGYIPEGYTLYEQRFMEAVRRANRIWSRKAGDSGSGVSLNEWEQSGWTYHAKGIWLSPNPDSPPAVTLFGSTNLNSRSAHIDTELSFLMIIPSSPPTTLSPQEIENQDALSSESATPCMTLRQELAGELEGIRSNATEWKGDGRHVRWTTKLLVWLVKGML